MSTNQEAKTYLVIPKVSSEASVYIPIGFLEPDVFSSDLVFISDSASLYNLGVLSSTMHMAWIRYTAGRLESRYRYSLQIVYNNYPWPKKPGDSKLRAVEVAAQDVLMVI